MLKVEKVHKYFVQYCLEVFFFETSRELENDYFLVKTSKTSLLQRYDVIFECRYFGRYFSQFSQKTNYNLLYRPLEKSVTLKH